MRIANFTTTITTKELYNLKGIKLPENNFGRPAKPISENS